MKLTGQEDQFLKQYLSKILKYRETYDELYDHIITALSHKTTITSFEQTVYDIITDDFGGHDNLMKLEKAFRKAAIKGTIRLFLIYFIGYFKFPKLLYTIAGIVMTYYFTLYVQLTLSTLEVICIPIVFLPGLYCSVKYLKTYNFVRKKAGRVFNPPTIKPQLKAGALPILSLFPYFAFLILINFEWVDELDFYNPHTVLTTLGLSICALYGLSLMKLRIDDFEINRTKIILAADKF